MKVSIITPCYNRASFIEETASSIFSQTYTDWEWVVVDDGSTDESWDILQKLSIADSRVKVYKRERGPKGAGTCRNIAIENCTGSYLLFLDTDDLLASFCLTQRVKAMQGTPSCDFIIFPMLVFKKAVDDTCLLWNVENGIDDINRLLYLDPLCGGTGTLWKKESFIAIGMWNEGLVLWQDVELHIRSLFNDVKYSKRMDLTPDIFVRMDEDSISRSNYHSIPKLRSRLTVMSKSLALALKKGKLEKYKEGFRNLAKEIFTGAADNNNLKELIPFWDLIEEYSLFSESEIISLKSYIRYRRLKLYKIPILSKVLLKKFYAISPSPEKMIIKVKYKGDIVL